MEKINWNRNLASKIHAFENPFDLFNEWFHEAVTQEISDPNAMSLATVSADGFPSIRMILLTGITDEKFIFYTNMNSRKAKEIIQNPRVSLCFYWKSLHRQIRIDGICEEISTDEAEVHFALLPVNTQICSWASQQSRTLKDRAVLEESLVNYALEFADRPVPRPPYWLGFKVKPVLIEFWLEQPFRLHDRLVYTLTNNSWDQKRLYP